MPEPRERAQACNAVKFKRLKGFRHWYRELPRAFRLLLTINVAVYFLWVLGLGYVPVVNEFVTEYLALHPQWPELLQRPWQMVTFSFLNLGFGFGGLLELGFYMLWLFWIGQQVDEVYGSHVLYSLYLLTAAGGAVFTATFITILGTEGVVITGASASILGLFTWFVLKNPRKTVGLALIGTFKLLHILFAIMVLEYLTSITSLVEFMPTVAGQLVGMLFFQMERRGKDPFAWAKPLFRKWEKQEREGLLSRVERSLARPADDEVQVPASAHRELQESEESKPAPVTEEDVDRVLDKINEHGMDALTPEDRSILESYSRSR